MAHRRRRTADGAGLTKRLLAIGLLAACASGCGGGAGNPGTAVSQAAKTTLADTAATTTTFTGTTLFGPVPGPIVAPGEFSFRDGIGYEAVHLGTAGGRTVYLMFLPNAVYLEPHSPQGPVLPAGKLWLYASFAGNADPRAVPPRGFAGEAEGLNPELPLSELAWGATAATPGRQVVLDHVPFREYDTTVDLELALARASGKSAAALRAAIRDQLAALRASRAPDARTIRIRAWVDGTGHVARLQTSPPGPSLGTATTSLGGFGIKVPTNPPNTGQVLGLRAPGAKNVSPWTLGGSSPQGG
jgi:hypothetical protein